MTIVVFCNHDSTHFSILKVSANALYNCYSGIVNSFIFVPLVFNSTSHSFAVLTVLTRKLSSSKKQIMKFSRSALKTHAL